MMILYQMLTAFFALLASLTPAHPAELTPTVIPVVINPGEHPLVSFSPDGRLLARHPSGAIASETQQIDLWDSRTGEPVYHAERISQFQWVGDGGQFFASFYEPDNYDIADRFIYDPYQQTEILRFEEGILEISGSSDWLVLSHGGKMAFRHAQRLNEPLTLFDGVESFTISTTGRYVAVWDRRLRIYRMNTGELVSELDHPYDSVTFNADDSAFITVWRGDYRLYTLTQVGAEVTTHIEAEIRGCGAPSRPEWYTTGTRVLFPSDGLVWDYAQGTRTRLNGQSHLSPDNRWIASLDYATLTLYDADSLEIVYTWDNTDAHARWSPDSRWLVTYGHHGYAHLYDVRNAVLVGRLPHYHYFGACGIYLFAPQWSPDSSRLVTYVFSTPHFLWWENDRGIVSLLAQQERLPYYAQPDDAEPIGYLEDGTAFTLRAIEHAGWHAFETDDGRAGWVNQPLALRRVHAPLADKIWLWNLLD